jgi:phosphoribosylglycinamide formyltransferase-1
MNSARERLPVVVLISGRGSNLRAIATGARAATLPVEICAVVSDRSDAAGLDWARDAGLHCVVLSPNQFRDRADYDEALAALVASFEPGLVVLAGFMRILGPAFVDRFEGRTLNIHPSLLPRHRGLDTHRSCASWDRRSSIVSRAARSTSTPRCCPGTVAWTRIVACSKPVSASTAPALIS